MTLLDMTLSASVLIGVILFLRAAALYRLPKWVFRVLWGVALVRMLVPVPLPSRFSIQNLAFPEAETVQTAPAEPVSPVTPGADPSAVQTAPATVQPPAASPAVPSAPAEPDPPQSAVSLWTVLWLAGVVLLAAALVLAYVRCLNRFRGARPVVGPRLEHWRTVCPGLDRVSVRVSGRVNSPMTYGLIHPVILLPNYTDWTDEEGLEYVFLHELTHIRNRDGWWKLALAAALCVHWFNPLAWWMYRAANQDIELSCDAAVMRRLGSDRRDAYALALLNWEERRGGLYPLCSGFGKKPMEERIVAIMKWKKTSTAAVAAALALVVGTTAVFATSGTTETKSPAPAQSAQSGEKQSKAAQTPAETLPSDPVLEDPAEAVPEDPSKDTPAAVELQKEETAKTSRYPRNQAGQTYGVWTEADGYDDVPDLIYYRFDAGTDGYLLRSDLYPYSYPVETEAEKAQYYQWYKTSFERQIGKDNVALASIGVTLRDQEGNDLPEVHQDLAINMFECTLTTDELKARVESGDVPRTSLPYHSVAAENIPAGRRWASSNLSPEELESEKTRAVMAKLVNGDYPRNSKGETYGPDWAEYTGYKPDLILVSATNGETGYITLEDDNSCFGYPYDIDDPDAAMDYMDWLKTQPRTYSVPVYDAEHENVLGEFTWYNDYGYDRTEEDIADLEENLELLEDQMKKLGYSDEEIAAKIQQERDSYGI